MIIGPAGGGKTIARQILQRALVFLPAVQHKEQNERHVEEVDDKGASHLVRVGKNTESWKNASFRIKTYEYRTIFLKFHESRDGCQSRNTRNNFQHPITKQLKSRTTDHENYTQCTLVDNF